jgi:ABC-type polysaccharide/polyol phosphate transport system ATPase subunit
VVVEGLSKSFSLPKEHVHTLKERALHPLRRQQFDVLRALRDVSITVERGEFFGIVGRNGSGKSTMLKCLAGIYGTDAGRIYVDGRLSAFIELGVGFNVDLAARDNILLNATMLGLSPREARGKVDAILDFAELEEFIDLRLKNYSSGMLVRLAFAVMIQVDADVLLIDEVLAVGDAAFQQKCYEEFDRVQREGKTVLFVTHDMSAVRRFCDRAMLLEHGRMVTVGDPETVGNRYLELNFSEDARAAESEEGAATVARAPSEEQRFSDGGAEIVDAWFEDETSTRSDLIKTSYPCSFIADVVFREAVTDPRFLITLHNNARDVMFAARSDWTDTVTGSFAPGERAQFRVYFGNVLGPDRYHVTVAVERPGGGWMDRRERMFGVLVTSTMNTGSLVQIPFDLGVHRMKEPIA